MSIKNKTLNKNLKKEKPNVSTIKLFLVYKQDFLKKRKKKIFYINFKSNFKFIFHTVHFSGILLKLIIKILKFYSRSEGHYKYL